MKIMNSNRGVSIVGTVFTMIILGVMGASLVALVATDQESRMRSVHRERAFYAVQAGFEYALREIKEGGYPIVQNKALESAAFTSAIDQAERKITVLGASSDVQKTYSITTALLGKDCLTANTGSAVADGLGNTQLQGVVLTHTTPNCLNAVSVDSISAQWTPNLSEKVKRIKIGGVNVYNDTNGVGSGIPANIQDVKITSTATINEIEFSSSISGKQVTLTFTLTDSSGIVSNTMNF